MKKLSVIFLGLALIGSLAKAGESEPLTITIKDHVFEPKEIHIPAGKKTVIKVKNLDTTPEEFESPGLRVEKVIPAGGEALVRLNPMAAGRYTFVGEYHEKTARGLAIVE